MNAGHGCWLLLVTARPPAAPAQRPAVLPAAAVSPATVADCATDADVSTESAPAQARLRLALGPAPLALPAHAATDRGPAVGQAARRAARWAPAAGPCELLWQQPCGVALLAACFPSGSASAAPRCHVLWVSCQHWDARHRVVAPCGTPHQLPAALTAAPQHRHRPCNTKVYDGKSTHSGLHARNVPQQGILSPNAGLAGIIQHAEPSHGGQSA